MIKEFEQMKGGLEKIDICQMKVSDDQVFIIENDSRYFLLIINNRLCIWRRQKH